MSWYSQPQPHILVFAGPNGSGKSTITKGVRICGTYINADDIKRQSNCTDLEAAQEAEQIRQRFIQARADFTFETVLSTDRNINLLKQAKELGYQIHAIFVLTCDPKINVQRVKARALAGGHNVPEEKIVSRYERSLKLLPQLVRIADSTRIIDNSGSEPHIICEIAGMSLSLWECEHWDKSTILRLVMGEYSANG